MDFRNSISAAFDNTRFDTIESNCQRPCVKDGRLTVPPALLRELSEEAFRQLSFYFRESHLELLGRAFSHSGASDNDRLVISSLLKNAVIASKGELALCQDTGTAIIYGWKDESIYTGCDDGEEFSVGVREAYRKHHLRASMVASRSFFDEFNTRDNLPAQIQIHSCRDNPSSPAYRLLFTAKGAGSSNKTSLFPMTKALLEKGPFEAFLHEKITALGTAACPPYRIAVVVGGTSPELNLEIQKLAGTEILDHTPYFSDGDDEDTIRSRAWLRRDRYWEERVMDIGRASGLGAQFGGSELILDARVFRLPRHAGSCPVSIGLSCSAHRSILGIIDERGLHLEKLCREPEAFLRTRFPELASPVPEEADRGIPRLNLDQGIAAACGQLSLLRAGDRLLLSGKLILARDAAHLKWHELLSKGKELPPYLLKYPVYYAGPAAAPPGKAIGSLGPTTAQRMDAYADELMSRGASLISLAKGNRTPAWLRACKEYGGFYLGTIGGAAALLAEEHVLSSETIDYPELGMEAVRLIEVKDIPAFIIIDDKGNDLYSPKPLS